MRATIVIVRIVFIEFQFVKLRQKRKTFIKSSKTYKLVLYKYIFICYIVLKIRITFRQLKKRRGLPLKFFKGD